MRRLSRSRFCQATCVRNFGCDSPRDRVGAPMSATSHKRTSCYLRVPLNFTYSFDVFDGYQAFHGSTLLLFESTVPTSLTQRLCPKASVTERPIALPPELVGAYAMQQSHIYDPPKPIDLPPCPRCGGQMWLTRIEPTDKPDYDQRTLECRRCEHSESMIVKFK